MVQSGLDADKRPCLCGGNGNDNQPKFSRFFSEFLPFYVFWRTQKSVKAQTLVFLENILDTGVVVFVAKAALSIRRVTYRLGLFAFALPQFVHIRVQCPLDFVELCLCCGTTE